MSSGDYLKRDDYDEFSKAQIKLAGIIPTLYEDKTHTATAINQLEQQKHARILHLENQDIILKQENEQLKREKN